MRPQLRKIILVESDPNWPSQFEAERAGILKLIGEFHPIIEHIGSTSIAGLAAKPTVDVMIGLARLADANTCVARFESLGYTYAPEYEDEMPYRRFFWKKPDGEPHFNVHVVERTHEFWERHLLFRDYLRDHPETAREYEELKRELAPQFGKEVNDYADAKGPFIRRIEAAARLKNDTRRQR